MKALFRETALVRLLGITKIPLIFMCSPRVQKLDDDGCEIILPLSYMTKNHLGSMYFGALSVGADLAGGLNAATLIYKQHKNVNLVFANFTANFKKRPDGDVLFRVTQGQEIKAAVEKAATSGERITIPVNITATVPDKYGDEAVAEFVLGLSLKAKKPR